MGRGGRSKSELPGLANPNERLLERASKGDRRAFASIFERYHQRLYRYCAAIVGDPEDARDALQNTMVSVLTALPGERRTIELEPWLYRIAHNEAIEMLRRRRPSVALDSAQLAGTAGVDTSLETRERLQRLLADLRELPERQRGALVMRELGGLSFEAIGETFGTSPQAARQMIYEARVGLQDMEGGRAMGCDEVRRKLSDGDRRLLRRRDVRAHLRQCARCRDFEREIADRRGDLAAIAPLPALAAGGILQALLGGGAAGGAAGQGAAATGAGAVGKVLGGSVLAKTVATGAVVVALGALAADRSGLIGVGNGGGSGQKAPAGAVAPASMPSSARSAPSAAAAGGNRGARTAALARGRTHSSISDQLSGAAAAAPGSQHATSHPAEHTPSAGAKAKGAGAANAHGANPNANSHAAVKTNNGNAGAGGNSGNHTQRHGSTPPKPAPSHEHPEKPEPPAKEHAAAPGQAAAHEPAGRRSPPEQPGEVAE